MAADKIQSMIGKRIGSYLITDEIGRGGMGVVYKAYEESLDREVALKFLPAHMVGDEKFTSRFLNEAKSVAKLEHPNIVPVYAAGEQDGSLYIAMQYVKGRTLSSWLDEQGTLPVKLALQIVRSVASALAFAHANNVIHRDIKPDNVMIDEAGNVKIMDFGLARENSFGTGMTQSGLYLGTPEYSSPEQCETISLDGRTDIYSLGVVLYEMLTGGLPHVAETPLALFKKITTEAAVSVRVLNSSVPRTVEALILKMMAKKREKRYASAKEVMADINKILRTEAIPGKSLTSQLQVNDQNLIDVDSKTIALKRPGGMRTTLANFLQQRYSRWIVAAAALLIVIGAAGVFGLFSNTPGGTNNGSNGSSTDNTAARSKLRLAVTGFRNFSGDNTLDNFGDMLRENASTKLAQLEYVQVESMILIESKFRELEHKAIASGQQFPAREELVVELARELNLGWIVSGGYYKENDKYIVNLEITDLKAVTELQEFVGSSGAEILQKMVDYLKPLLDRYSREGGDKFAAADIKSGPDDVIHGDPSHARIDRESQAVVDLAQGSTDHSGVENVEAQPDKPRELAFEIPVTVASLDSITKAVAYYDRASDCIAKGLTSTVQQVDQILNDLEKAEAICPGLNDAKRLISHYTKVRKQLLEQQEKEERISDCSFGSIPR